MTIFEQKYALRLLEARSNGYTVGFWLRMAAVRYLVVLGGLAVIVLGYLIESNDFNSKLALFFLGSGLGVFWRDIAFFRASRRIWPLSERVMDWNKVQQLADGKPVDSPP